MTIFLIAAGTMAAGMILGYKVCGMIARRAKAKARAKRAAPATEEQIQRRRVGVMNTILVFEAVLLLAYTVTVLIIFWHTSSEPAVLTGCVFGVCGLENGVMGWIKTNKDSLGNG